jgi:hypothetical protein
MIWKSGHWFSEKITLKQKFEIVYQLKQKTDLLFSRNWLGLIGNLGGRGFSAERLQKG